MFRAGFGQFYDHVPLNVYTFSRYPQRTVTFYNPDGSINGAPIEYVNVIGSITGPRSFFVNGEQVAGGFSPRGATWNVQVEHTFATWFHVRGVYSDNRSVGLVVFEPSTTATGNEIALNGDASAHYRQGGNYAKFNWKNRQQILSNFSYVLAAVRKAVSIASTATWAIFPIRWKARTPMPAFPGDLPNWLFRVVQYSSASRQADSCRLSNTAAASRIPASLEYVVVNYAGAPLPNRFNYTL